MIDDHIPPRSRKSLAYRGKECLNCGHALEKYDRYCPYCGQLNSTKKLSLYDYFQEFVLSVFVYDSKVWYTIKDLLFRPGRLTKNYTSGQRQKYANPFRFFLSVSILYFLLSGFLNLVDGDDPYLVQEEGGSFIKIGSNDNTKKRKSVNDSLIGGSSDISKTIADAIDAEKANDTLPQKKGYDYIAKADLDTLGNVKGLFRKVELFNEFYRATEIKKSKQALDSLKYPDNRFNNWLYSRNNMLERINDAPLPFVDYVSGKIPFFLFFFTPVFALFFLLIYFRWQSFDGVLCFCERIGIRKIRLLFDRKPFLKKLAAFLLWPFCVSRRFTYMEHVIFIFHIFTFIFLVLLLCKIPDHFISDNNYLMGFFMLVVAPIYFYKALRIFYEEERWLTILKCIVINLVFFIVGGMAGLLFFLITMATY